MRQRITFIHRPEHAIDPYNIDIGPDSLSLSGLKAVREDKITFGLETLPDDVQLVLANSLELHVRFARDTYQEKIAPLVSTLSPGVHVFYSPRPDKSNPKELCLLLNRVFGVADISLCRTIEDSFVSLPSQTYPRSTTHSYYIPQSAVGEYAITDFFSALCVPGIRSCNTRIPLLASATSIDFDYTTGSQSVHLGIVYPHQSWTTSLVLPTPHDRLEVGVLSPEKAVEKEELSLGGFLTVVGEDSRPKPTLFAFPARHHQHSSTFSTRFLSPTGLHPDLQITVSDTKPPIGYKEGSCWLNTYLTLPKAIFADKYQFSDALFLASKNLTALRHASLPVDLEAPEYATPLWGSSLLLELATPEGTATASPLQVEIPLHLRYKTISKDGTGYLKAQVPEPVVFWACTADENSRFTVNPFDRAHLGYDGLFEPQTIFYHLKPIRSLASADGAAGGDGFFNVRVPVLDVGDARVVELGTAATVLVGFTWVLWKVWGIWSQSGYGSGRHVVVEEEKKTK